MKRWSSLFLAILFILGGLKMIQTGHFRRFNEIAEGSPVQVAGLLSIIAGIWLFASWIQELKKNRK
jgi:cytochrome b subunit of formate dehydrogenase